MTKLQSSLDKSWGQRHSCATRSRNRPRSSGASGAAKRNRRSIDSSDSLNAHIGCPFVCVRKSGRMCAMPDDAQARLDAALIEATDALAQLPLAAFDRLCEEEILPRGT